MKFQLSLKFLFEASHSLSGYEKPHAHLWRLEFSLAGDPVNQMIVDLVKVREQVEELLRPLKGRYLNDNPHVNDAVRSSPTCETLSPYFYQRIQTEIIPNFLTKHPTLNLSSLTIGIGELDGTEAGAVTVTA